VAAIKKIDQPKEVWDRLFATPGHLAVITTVDAKGNVNAGSFATCVRVVHDPMHIAFTTQANGDTANNIRETGQFTVNLPRFERELLEKVSIVGLPFARGVNELEKAGLTALPARKVKPPRAAECPRHFECEVIWTHEWTGRLMIVGNTLAASVDEDGVDEHGFIRWDRVKPTHFCGSPYNNVTPDHLMFVGAYETMTVAQTHTGPEVKAQEPNWKKL
jgi:flavin reductase (DIM6/NTAB) family NADH-FMN oxidoreductase RutF